MLTRVFGERALPMSSRSLTIVGPPLGAGLVADASQLPVLRGSGPEGTRPAAWQPKSRACHVSRTCLCLTERFRVTLPSARSACTCRGRPRCRLTPLVGSVNELHVTRSTIAMEPHAVRHVGGATASGTTGLAGGSARRGVQRSGVKLRDGGNDGEKVTRRVSVL